MPQGVLRLAKTAKGKIIVSLDRLNGKPPMPVSYVSFNNLDLNDNECEYLTDQTGRIILIKVNEKVVFGNNFATPVINAPASASRPMVSNTNIENAGTRHPVLGFADSISISETKLPQAVKRLGNFDIDNFALKYQKAARCIVDDKGKEKFYFFKNDYRQGRDGRSDSGHKFFIRPNYGSLDFEGIRSRQEAQVKALFPNAKSTVVKVTPDWRMICGLSGGIYETNMTLHHVYGVPYIPASSIKGVVRSWIITNIFTESIPLEEQDFPLVNAEYRALKSSKLFCAIFGSPESIDRVKFQYGKPLKKKDKNGKETDKYETEKDTSAVGKEQQGKVVFFDGLPISAPEMMPDVINVHYPDWYKEKGFAAPRDFQKTNPVMFLTVTSNSNFQTAIASDNTGSIEKWDEFALFANPAGLNKDSTLVELATKWLNLALTSHGIGAKTAVGYGYMKPTQ
jgi:CRISPR-associated protein Cmr6